MSACISRGIKDCPGRGVPPALEREHHDDDDGEEADRDPGEYNE